MIRGRSSDLRLWLLARPSHPNGQWRFSAFAVDYSGGSVTDLHRLPFWGSTEPPKIISYSLVNKTKYVPNFKIVKQFSKYFYAAIRTKRILTSKRYFCTMALILLLLGFSLISYTMSIVRQRVACSRLRGHVKCIVTIVKK